MDGINVWPIDFMLTEVVAISQGAGEEGEGGGGLREVRKGGGGGEGVGCFGLYWLQSR